MSERDAARFRVSADVAARDIEEGMMLLNLQTGMTWKLNHVGAAVCRKLDGATAVAGIVAELDSRYHVGIETLRRDIDALLEDLRKNGLVEVVPVEGQEV